MTSPKFATRQLADTVHCQRMAAQKSVTEQKAMGLVVGQGNRILMFFAVHASATHRASNPRGLAR